MGDNDLLYFLFSALPHMYMLWPACEEVLIIHNTSDLMQGAGQKKRSTLYIIDVIAVYGDLVANKPHKERYIYMLLIINTQLIHYSHYTLYTSYFIHKI